MKNLPISETEFRGLAHITRRLEFFRSYTGGQLDAILSHLQLYAFDRGETVFKKGDTPVAFYIIYDGQVRIHLGYRLWGLFRKMAHLSSGDLFGEIALIENRPHSATAVAELPTKLFVLLRDDFDKLLQGDPEFAELIKFVASRRKFETTH